MILLKDILVRRKIRSQNQIKCFRKTISDWFNFSLTVSCFKCHYWFLWQRKTVLQLIMGNFSDWYLRYKTQNEVNYDGSSIQFVHCSRMLIKKIVQIDIRKLLFYLFSRPPVSMCWQNVWQENKQTSLQKRRKELKTTKRIECFLRNKKSINRFKDLSKKCSSLS